MCAAIMRRHLGAGEVVIFPVDWPTAAGLQPGTYTVHGSFLTWLALGALRVRENIPIVAVQITR